MGDFNKQICRLCLVISPTCECESVDEIKKEMLQVLEINMNFDISDYAVACNKCLERLQDCFDFKSRIITTLMVDIKKISQREMIGESLCLKKFQGCRLCMSLIKEEAFNYTGDLKGAVLLEDMIRNCFPEVDLNTHAHESRTCKQCVSSLERHYEFMKWCQEVEQKVVHFCQVADHCIADKVNLDDMIKFKDYDMLGTPLIIKKECSDAENDEIATKCPESEEIASIKCEEIHIKDELDDGNKTSINKKKKKHKCHYCDYETQYTCDLKTHVSAIHEKGNVKEYYCQHCTFKTVHRSSLYRHARVHKEKVAYKCPECQKKFHHKVHFDNHLLMTHDSLWHLITCRVYYCTFCTYKTTRTERLKSHIIHNHKVDDAKKFQCHKCDYVALEKHVIKRHIQIHSRPYLCSACKKRFALKITLDSHILSKHKENEDLLKRITNQIHYCPFCTYETVNRHYLYKHLKSQHKESSK